MYDLDEIDCPDCSGTGYDFGDGGQCDRCGGTGTIDVEDASNSEKSDYFRKLGNDDDRLILLTIKNSLRFIIL